MKSKDLAESSISFNTQRVIYALLSCLGVAMIAVLPGCGVGEPGGGGRGDDEEAAVPKPKNYDLTLGDEVLVDAKIVRTSGDVITVDEPGHPLQGFALEIPGGAFDQTLTFKISYAPIEEFTEDDNFNPISPLVKIDHEGGCSNELLRVKVPAKVPEDHFAMAFTYNPESRTLEGLPLLSSDGDSVTVATRHFSDLLVSSIPLELLDELIKSGLDTGFKPGVDDWQFPNYGSVLHPGGHCAGQSISAMWYFCEKRMDGEDPLYGRYDHNGADPKSPDIWQDDVWGYKFASTVQGKIEWDSRIVRLMRAFSSIDDKLTWRAITYSMLLTGEPQYISIRNDRGGHALAVYKVEGDLLYVADPNYPGNEERAIKFANDSFSPYNSGPDADNLGVQYPTIHYLAKSAMLDWESIGRWWDQIVAGNDDFPRYRLTIVEDGKEQRLTEDFRTEAEEIDIRAEIVDVDSLHSIDLAMIKEGMDRPRLLSKENGLYSVKFQPGDERVGLWIIGNGEWLGFHWITVAGAEQQQATTAGDKEILKLRFNEGDQFNLLMKMDMDMEQTVQGRAMDIDMDMSFGFVMDVIDIPAPDRFDVELTYKSIAFRMSAMGMTAEYDSQNPQGATPELKNVMEGLVGEKFQATMLADGRVVDVRGMDKILDRIIANAGPGAALNRQQMEQQLNDQAMKDMLSRITPYYPSYPVGIGDTWPQRMEIVTSSVPIVVDVTWSLREVKQDSYILGADCTITSDPSKPADMGQATATMDLSGNQTGWVEIEKTNCMAFRAEIEQNISGTMHVEAGGQSLSIPLKIHTKAYLEPMK